MVLSDGNLYLLDSDVLNTIGSGPKIKNVTVFCVNENPNTLDPFTVQVGVKTAALMRSRTYSLCSKFNTWEGADTTILIFTDLFGKVEIQYILICLFHFTALCRKEKMHPGVFPSRGPRHPAQGDLDPRAGEHGHGRELCVCGRPGAVLCPQRGDRQQPGPVPL